MENHAVILMLALANLTLIGMLYRAMKSETNNTIPIMDAEELNKRKRDRENSMKVVNSFFPENSLVLGDNTKVAKHIADKLGRILVETSCSDITLSRASNDGEIYDPENEIRNIFLDQGICRVKATASEEKKLYNQVHFKDKQKYKRATVLVIMNVDLFILGDENRAKTLTDFLDNQSDIQGARLIVTVSDQDAINKNPEIYSKFKTINVDRLIYSQKH